MNTQIDNIDFKELSKTCKTQEDLSGLTKEFMKNMIENMLKAELEEHIRNNDNTSKNGYYSKTVRSDDGNLTLDIPRDRNSEYKPQLIPKGRTTISGIDDKIISMYARGMSLRDIVLVPAGLSSLRSSDDNKEYKEEIEKLKKEKNATSKKLGEVIIERDFVVEKLKYRSNGYKKCKYPKIFRSIKPCENRINCYRYSLSYSSSGHKG